MLVWLHGGGFTGGSGSQGFYDPTALVRRGDVVVVTLNYRLGALGFLYLGADGAARLGATANVGLLDQIEALAWVRDNAAALGGDPDNVTIFGESSGARSVATLLGTPAARGLFHRAIAQSGGASHGHDEASASEVRGEFLRELGIAEHELERLRELPVATLARSAGARGRAPDRHARLAPVPARRRRRGAAGARARGDLRRALALRAGHRRQQPRRVEAVRGDGPEAARARRGGTRRARARARARTAMPCARRRCSRAIAARGEARVGTTPLDVFCALETDRVYRIPALRLADAQRAAGGRVFAYHFTRPTALLGGALGACHAAEVPFVFGTVGTPAGVDWSGSGPEVDALAACVMDAWTSFARDGVPAARDLPEWKPYTTERRETLELGTPCSMQLDPGAATRRLWDGNL